MTREDSAEMAVFSCAVFYESFFFSYSLFPEYRRRRCIRQALLVHYFYQSGVSYYGSCSHKKGKLSLKKYLIHINSDAHCCALSLYMLNDCVKELKVRRVLLTSQSCLETLVKSLFLLCDKDSHVYFLCTIQ